MRQAPLLPRDLSCLRALRSRGYFGVEGSGFFTWTSAQPGRYRSSTCWHRGGSVEKSQPCIITGAVRQLGFTIVRKPCAVWRTAQPLSKNVTTAINPKLHFMWATPVFYDFN